MGNVDVQRHISKVEALVYALQVRLLMMQELHALLVQFLIVQHVAMKQHAKLVLLLLSAMVVEDAHVLQLSI